MQDITKLSDRELDNILPGLFSFSATELKNIRSSRTLRKKLLFNVLRVLNYFGFNLSTNPTKLKIIKKLYRIEGEKVVGLFSKNDSVFILLNTLQDLKMDKLHLIITLAICKAMESEPLLMEKFRRIYEEKRSNDTPTDLRGLEYIRNSCYQDSVLMALLTGGFDFFTENYTNLGKEIENLHNYIFGYTGSSNVKNLRYILSYTGNNNFHTDETQDAGEFLMFICDLFKVETMNRKRETFVGHPDGSETQYQKVMELTEKTSPVYLIHSFDDNDEINLQNYLFTREESKLDTPYIYQNRKYFSRIEINQVVSASYLIFHVQRVYPTENNQEKRTHANVIFPLEIILHKVKLYLHAIVVHESNHYTCYFFHRGTWYYYDDISSEKNHLRKIDNFLSTPNPSRLGTLYFYTETLVSAEISSASPMDVSE